LDTINEVDHQIILFDGVCNLCNNSVNFIIERDKNEKFLFTSLQSEAGKSLLKKHDLSAVGMASIILLSKTKVYDKSTAALKIASQLSGLWPLLYIFIIVPTFIRDYFYTLIANNRYRWFGRTEACQVPTPELKRRFI